MNLREHRQDVGWYMRSLEEVIIRTLHDFGIVAMRMPGNIGVWVDERRKIAALGVRIEDWTTYHGFALNVAPDLSHFRLIIPCGLVGKEATSMEKVLGTGVDMGKVRERVRHNFGVVFGTRMRKVGLRELFPFGQAECNHEVSVDSRVLARS